MSPAMRADLDSWPALLRPQPLLDASDLRPECITLRVSERDRLLEFLDGLRQMSLGHQRIPPVAVDTRILRVHCNHPAVLVDRPLQIVLGLESAPPAQEDNGKLPVL